jgi:glycosyltransferase involved in cell wall biosynthesis
MSQLAPAPAVSVVIPVYNEEESVDLLCQQLHTALSVLDRSYEIVLVDDGSSDRTWEKLVAQTHVIPHLRVIRFRRNFGQTAAMSAGFHAARGEVIVTLDADLQNDPADIPKLLARMDQGYDVVSGWRKNRKDTFVNRRLPSIIANGLISKITGVALHDYGCTLKAYRREALEGFRLYGEMHRFIPVFAHSVGAKIAELPVRHHPRKFGVAKYGLERTVKVVLDLFTVKFLLDYSHKPMRLFGGTGISLILGGILLLLFLFVRKIFFLIPVLTSPFFQISVMLLILGFQSILMGLIAELLARTYHESQSKPTYTIRAVLGKKR